jgi:hypothetical protein
MSMNGGPARIPDDMFAGHIAESDSLSRVPPGTKLIPVGGISAGNIPRGVPPARPASVSGRPCFVREMTVPTVQRKAPALVAAYRAGESA